MTLVLIRGGGELGTAVGHALHSAGLRVVVLDRPLPGTLRHGVAFATAAVEGSVTVRGVTAELCHNRDEVARDLIDAVLARGQVPVFTREEGALGLDPDVIIDARMRQLSEPLTDIGTAPLVIGIGPGFVAGRDVHCVLESNRGPRLGEVIEVGAAEQHTGTPGEVLGFREERLLRAPCKGTFVRKLSLGEDVEVGDVVGHVDDEPVVVGLRGMVRGLKLTGVVVGRNHKVGDVDPRRDRALLREMTDKALAVGRGAVRAVALGGLLPAARCVGTAGITMVGRVQCI